MVTINMESDEDNLPTTGEVVTINGIEYIVLSNTDMHRDKVFTALLVEKQVYIDAHTFATPEQLREAGLAQDLPMTVKSLKEFTDKIAALPDIFRKEKKARGM